MQLLIIGTLDGQVGAASQIAISGGAKVAHVPNVDKGLEYLRAGRGADLVMVDVTLEIGTLVTSLENERINVPVVACGVATDSAAAVRAIRAGAMEYIPLPPDAELIGAVLAAISEESHALIFRDPAMAEVVRMAEQVAASDASVLITGASGTGKELIARHLHGKSRRTAKFVAVNCAAIPDNLLESELFGHERGAFTGAIARRIGKFEEADGGTLLLDEISEMNPHLQAKLLRVVQERELDRLGSNKSVKVDVRIIATSNRAMQDEVAKGNFREDLYFRLNVVNLHLPSLAERPADIELLAKHFVTKYAKANEMPALPLSDATKAALADYHWPGNVRELENTMHRAVLMGGPDEIGIDAIMLNSPTAGGTSGAGSQAPAHAGDGAGGSAGRLVGKTVAEVERGLIIDTLSHCLGNRTHAANILGISIRTLRNKLKAYSNQGFDVPVPGEGRLDPA